MIIEGSGSIRRGRKKENNEGDNYRVRLCIRGEGKENKYTDIIAGSGFIHVIGGRRMIAECHHVCQY